MQSVFLTEDEITIIAAALHAVSPSGGGSDQYTVARKFSALAQNDGKVEMRTMEFLYAAAAEFNDGIEA